MVVAWSAVRFRNLKANPLLHQILLSRGGSNNSRNTRVKWFPEYLGQIIPGIGGSKGSGIFTGGELDPVRIFIPKLDDKVQKKSFCPWANCGSELPVRHPSSFRISRGELSAGSAACSITFAYKACRQSNLIINHQTLPAWFICIVVRSCLRSITLNLS